MADEQDRSPAPPGARLGAELLVLARRHPRAGWQDGGLGALARFWLQRHALFRELDQRILQESERALAERLPAAVFQPWLGQALSLYLGQLDEHHWVEDHHYFPLFRRAEPKLEPGFVLLESDHAALDAALGELAGLAQDVLRPGAKDAPARDALARFRERHAALGKLLVQHLDDEEDLVVPLLLEHGEARLLAGPG